MREGLSKLVFLISALIFVFQFANAENLPLLAAAASRPVWKDFCPKGLEKAEYKEIKWFWPEGTKSTQAIYNYWAERRKDFEAGLAECDTMQNELNSMCYETLREHQLFVNEQYSRNIQQKQITNQIWRDTHDKGSSPIIINIFMK